MSDQSRMLLRALVGGYLIYLGGGLGMDAIQNRPENYVIFILVGIFFVAVGAGILVFGAKGYMKAKREDEEAEAAEAEEEEDESCE